LGVHAEAEGVDYNDDDDGDDEAVKQ